jgi:uncharacterized membrane protein
MLADPLFILAVLALNIVISEWLARHTVLRHAGAALLVIVVTAIAANLGIIPSSSTAAAPVPVYDAVFTYVAPISIFWLLLQVNLRDVMKAGLPLIALFLIGSVGTVAGAIAGMSLVHGSVSIGPLFKAVGGMYAATYTGGSVNFNAVALQYGVVEHGALYGGAIVVDNVITAAWMAATIALPRMLAPFWPARTRSAPTPTASAGVVESHDDTEWVGPMEMGLVLVTGLLAQWASVWLADVLERHGIVIAPILIITTLALVLAQIPAVSRMKGARVLGMFAVYLFLAVIGAFCDVRTLAGLGELGVTLLTLAATIVVVHGVVIFGAARLLRIDPDGASVASQANIGGSTSALALARSLGREDLILPGILLGALGNAIGTYIGFLTAARLLG